MLGPMMMSKKRWFLLGGAILIIAVGLIWYMKHQTPAFPINPQDQIAAWDFKGAYTDNETLTTQANADMAHLVSLLGKGEFDDYDLYIGIGNDYNLEGNGKAAYDNYDRAAAIHPDKGLAYANLGHLMDELGAPYTAADAYAAAVKAEPTQLEYHIDRLTYLTRQFPEDKERLLAAFTDASDQFGDTAPILAIEAGWLTGLGRYTDAIAAWQRAKLLSPGKDTSAIDTEIARLKAKQ
jgi:tetratricopeptide (TPR) repeat protein